MTTFSTIYAFGDSLSDAGNAWLLTNSPYAAGLQLSAEPVSPPYFRQTYGNVTADVFSNGPVWTQDLANALGLGTLAPAGAGAFANTVLSVLTAEVGASQAAIDVVLLELATGVSGPNPYIPLVAGATGGTDFAIGGAVTGPTNENSPVTELSGLAAQLATFHRDVPVPATTGLATVSIGGNDVLNVLEDPNFATLYGADTTLATVAATAAGKDISQAVSIEAGFLSGLMALGVTNAVVMNVPDVGKTPEALGRGASQAAAGTVLSQYYNDLLSADIASLNTGGAQIVIADAFSLIDAAVASPGSFGLQNVTSPVYSGSSSSFMPADLVSTDPAVQNTFLFFDKLHPTETGARGLAQVAQLALTSCFATGTRIRTMDGDVPVEALRIGTRVVLAEGETAPIIWIGHRAVECTSEPDPSAAWPVRVRANTFGPGLPVCDLDLSPDHAIFIDGVLIPVKHLIDGIAITPVACESVTWWHVELPSHEVLLAEGLPCESFLDTGARDDAGMRRPRRPDYVSLVWETEACAELVIAGSRLANARKRIVEISQAQGLPAALFP